MLLMGGMMLRVLLKVLLLLLQVGVPGRELKQDSRELRGALYFAALRRSFSCVTIHTCLSIGKERLNFDNAAALIWVQTSFEFII